MKLSGPNPQALFLTLPCSGLKPLHPSRGPQPPLFSTIIPCRSRHCQSTGLRGKEGRIRRVCASVFGYMCVCFHIQYLCAWVNICDWICACMHKLQITRTCAHVAAECYKVGVVWGISSEGAGCFKPYEQRWWKLWV